MSGLAYTHEIVCAKVAGYWFIPPALWDPCLHPWCCGTLVYTSCPVIPLFTPFGGPIGDPHLDPWPSSTPWPEGPLSIPLACGTFVYTSCPVGLSSTPPTLWVPHLHPWSLGTLIYTCSLMGPSSAPSLHGHLCVGSGWLSVRSLLPTPPTSMGSSPRKLSRVPFGIHSLVLFRVPAPGGHPGVLGLHWAVGV